MWRLLDVKPKCNVLSGHQSCSLLSNSFWLAVRRLDVLFFVPLPQQSEEVWQNHLIPRWPASKTSQRWYPMTTQTKLLMNNKHSILFMLELLIPHILKFCRICLQ